MKLSQALRLSSCPRLALVGAGGKTSALFQLARELEQNGEATHAEPGVKRAVMVSATTHLHIDQIHLADSHWMGEKLEDLSQLEENLQGVMLVTGPVDGNRTTGLNSELTSWLHKLCDSHHLPLLIEADGSSQKPLKAPAEYEPVIPEWIAEVVVVAGLTGLDKPLTTEFVHRPEIFARLCGMKLGDQVTPEALVRLLNHPSGGLKDIPPGARRVVLLNQADRLELQALGKTMSTDLLSAYQAVIVASLGKVQIHATYEPVAGIILAAGGSSRYGQSKQLLDWHGRPFVHAVAETALTAGLAPVIVVAGAQADQIEDVVKDLPVTTVRNRDWQNGQSTSIKAGLNMLIQRPSPTKGEDCGSVIFLLSDQPQVSPAILNALTEEHARSLAPIVVPLVEGRNANPVLFDRIAFPELMAISGDVGGRAIFNKFAIDHIPWHEASLLSDVDTPEEYRKLIDGQ
jgi:molybdenum cofactor cytidylyltransferase